MQLNYLPPKDPQFELTLSEDDLDNLRRSLEAIQLTYDSLKKHLDEITLAGSVPEWKMDIGTQDRPDTWEGIEHFRIGMMDLMELKEMLVDEWNRHEARSP